MHEPSQTGFALKQVFEHGFSVPSMMTSAVSASWDGDCQSSHAQTKMKGLEMSIRSIFRLCAPICCLLLADLNASAAAENLNNLDVGGLKLGLSQEQIENIIRSFDSHSNFRPRSGSIVIGQYKSREITWGEDIKLGDMRNPNIHDENFGVIFDPNGKYGALLIKRNVSYQENQGPLISDTIEALKEKYGEPTYVDTRRYERGNEVKIYWSSKNDRLTDEQLSECASISGNDDMGYGSFSTDPSRFQDYCGTFLYVRLFVNEANPTVLHGFWAELSDVAEKKKANFEFIDYIDREEKAFREGAKNNGNSIKPSL